MSGKILVRESSGLVRNISAWDALILNVMFMAPTAVFVYGIWASAIYPGVHLPTTALLAIPISIIVGLFYAIYSAAMPRSGGDYIWVSRVLHPAVGFMINFFIFMVLLSVAGAYVPWFTQWALAPMLQFNGYETAATVVASNEFTFLAAVIIYLIFAAIVSRGAKATATALWVFFSLVFIGLITYSVMLLSIGPENFIANFNAKSGMDYYQAIEAAKKAGYVGTFILPATLLGLVFTYMNFIGFHSSVYAAGEIKEVQRSQLIAIVGSIVVFGFITWLAYQITYYGMGGIFVGALSYLWAIGDPAYKLPFTDGPFFPFLFQYATDSKLLYTFVMVCWSAMILGAILTYIAITVRLVFAWSFDRIVPTSLSKVDRRYNSPYMALIFVTIIAIILQAAWIWTPLINYFAYAVFGWMIAQIIVGITGIAFPYRRRDIWEKAPAIVRAKIGGVPWLAILAILTIGVSAWLAYGSMSPALVGAIDPIILVFTFGLFILALVIYGISSLYHRRVGIPLELTFKEIPPE